MRRLLALALLLPVVSCGSESDKTAPFVGTWTVTTGTLTGMCVGLPMPFTQKLDGGQQTITKNADGSLSISILPGCNIILDVNGSVATLRATTPPQMCSFQFSVMGTSLPVRGTFTAGNFTVTGDTASFSYMGMAMAGPLSCPVTGIGMSKKGAAPDAAAPAADTGSSPDTGSPDTTTGSPDTTTGSPDTTTGPDGP